MLTALRGCLSQHPVLVAIDDVQWLDEASREVLAFALRRVPAGSLSLLVIARTVAPGDPLTAGAPPPSSDWRELLAALPAAEMIDLAPLYMWQIQNLLPPDVTAAQARMVARESRGNPFWALQISASRGAADSQLPLLARTLTDRLSRLLSADAADALAVVAAAGRIEVAEVLAVLDHLADSAAAVDATVLTGVVVETGGRLSAAHPLIGAAAVESLPPGRRAQLYRGWSASQPIRNGTRTFAALAAAPGPDGAVAEALDAGAAAAHARAANAAAAQFATQAVLFTPEPDGDALDRRRIRAAELMFLAGDAARSLEHLEMLDIDQLATADLERALPLLLDMTDFAHGAAAATAIAAHAVEAAGRQGADPRRRALVLALASDATYGIRGGKRKAAVDSISCAEQVGAPADAALHRALINLFVAKLSAVEGSDTALLDRAARLEASLPAVRLYDSADTYRGWCRYTEDLDTARAALDRLVSRARDIGYDWALSFCLFYQAMTALLAGDYAAASEAVAASDAAARWYHWRPTMWFVEPRCELLIAAGDLDAAICLVDDRLPDDVTASAARRCMGAYLRGKVSAWRGDYAATIRHLEIAVRCAEQCGWLDPGIRGRADIQLAEAYAASGRPGDARLISARLGELGERLDRPALTGDAARIDALVAAAAGDLDAAAESARAAVTAHGSSPLRLELARSLLVLGQVERRRKARRQSRDTLRRAHDLADEMGHRPLLAQIGGKCRGSRRNGPDAS